MLCISTEEWNELGEPRFPDPSCPHELGDLPACPQWKESRAFRGSPPMKGPKAFRDLRWDEKRNPGHMLEAVTLQIEGATT